MSQSECDKTFFDDDEGVNSVRDRKGAQLDRFLFLFH